MSAHGTEHVSTEALFRQHSGFVARFLVRLGVPPDHVEDALQEVFLVVHRQGGYRPGIAKPTSYLANIAIRAASQHRRRQAVARTRSSDAKLERIASETEDPAHALQAHQDLERFQLALQRLPEDLRTTLLLVEVEGESCISVAAGLGCPVGTVYWRLHQARKKLKSALATLDVLRREPRIQPAAAQLDKRAVPLGSLAMFGLFDFRSSEAERLLRLVREQQASTAPADQLLARHRELVQSGAELPAWASNWAPHTASWASVLGLGPIAIGATAVGAVTVALLLSPSAEPAPAPRPQARPAVAITEPARIEPAKAIATEPAEAIATEPAEGASRAAVPPKRRPTTTTPRSTIQGDESARTSGGAAPSAKGAAAATTSQPSAVADEQPKAEPAEPKPAEPKPAEPEPSVSYDPTVAEMREVAEAERLLSSDPKQALELTRRMRAHHEVGYFAEERVYVEVMALQRLGRTDELRDRAAEFLRAYPDGPYTARVRKALASAPPQSNR